MECEKVIPEEILVDLCSRFVINVPVEEQSDLIRICFQVELAHWFYIDFYSKNFPHKRPCGLREFTLQVFKHIPFLQPFSKNIDEVIEEWKEYKYSVPTYGAIILNEDLTQVLLVQNYKSCYGFPKGKVNKDEPPYQCAIREVYEETGFDISNLLHPNYYLEVTINEKVIRLYIIPGVSKLEEFIPKTRNEIKAVEWFSICDIPLSKKDAAFRQLQSASGTTSNAVFSAFYMVSPFMRKLRQWIYEHSNNLPHRKRRQRHKSCSDIDQLNHSKSIEMFKKIQDSDKASKNIDNHEIPEELELNSGVKAIFGTNASEAKRGRMEVSSEIDYILNLEKRKLTLEQNYVPGKGYVIQDSWNFAEQASNQTLLSITSGDSAFRKVEKTTKANKRKRKSKGNIAKEENRSAGAGNTVDMPNHSLTGRKRLTCIPAFLNFRFDVDAVVQAMTDAVIRD